MCCKICMPLNIPIINSWISRTQLKFSYLKTLDCFPFLKLTFCQTERMNSPTLASAAHENNAPFYNKLNIVSKNNKQPTTPQFSCFQVFPTTIFTLLKLPMNSYFCYSGRVCLPKFNLNVQSNITHSDIVKSRLMKPFWQTEPAKEVGRSFS